MCDKKNSVLFTKTECLVLSPDFKLLDESQVLLKVPRQNNMYSFDLKNVVPSGGLTCLFAKAKIDESNLWHRRLGHINFKTMNKLVKGNLVRGLPSKLFENDHTCVACQKGKQHKASLGLVRCDNGIEFKNNDMNQLRGMKGIKREFSVARILQQNRVAERKNRTLIEAARTMLANSLLPTTFWAEACSTAKKGYANSTNRDSTVSPSVSTAGQSFTNANDLPSDPLMPDMEDTVDLLNTGIFSGAYDDDDDVGAEVDLNNLETTINISEELAMVSYIKKQRRTNHKDYQNCLFACFLSQIEPKKVTQALTDPIWIEAMQDELLQFSLQKVMQRDDGIFISQDKCVADILKKFDFVSMKTASTPIDTNKALLKDEEAEDVDVHLYRSMIGSLMYLTASRPDIMFVVCTCARFQVTPKVLWIQNQMLDYGFNFMNTKIYIDNESTICIVKNLVFHSKTKHIEIRHHFIRDSYEKKLIQVIKIHTDHNVADLLTKAFDVSRKAKRTTEISQSSGPIPLVTDETVIKEWEDRMEKAATTASSLEAEQDSGNINRIQSMATLNESFPLGTDSCSGLRLNLLLPVLVYAARQTLIAVRHKLMLIGITCYCLFWASTKAKIVNGERQIQALVDKKKVIIIETSIRSDLKLDDAEGIDCLPTASIFPKLERMGAKTIAWNEFSSTMAFAIICLATNQTFNFSKYIFDNMVKHLEGGVKFLMYPRRVTPLFPIMMIQSSEDMGKDSAAPSDSTPIISQPSSFKPQKKKLRRKQRKYSGPTEPDTNEAHVSTPSYDPPQSGEDSMQLSKLMNLCTSLQEKVLDLEKAKTTQAKEIASLKKRVKQLERRRKLRTLGFKRLRKERTTEDLDADAEVTLVNETQEMNDDNLMFDIVSVATTTKLIPVSAAEVVTTASVEIPDTLTLVQTLIEIKTTKPKLVTTAVTIVTSVRPRAKGIIFHDQEEQVPTSTKTFSSSQSQLPHVKDRSKGKMVEPKNPLKKKDQIALDEEMARNLKVQMEAELIVEERLARQKEEETNIVLIES
ncbi:ribonuclease H-like domain-containing protein [Tanacetum coccineum]